MRICFPSLLLNRPRHRDPTNNDFHQEAKSLFSFSTDVEVKEPSTVSKSGKKRKVEEVASGKDGEVDTEVAPEEEILAQVSLPLPEPEELPVSRLIRARRADRA